MKMKLHIHNHWFAGTATETLLTPAIWLRRDETPGVRSFSLMMGWLRLHAGVQVMWRLQPSND